MQSDLESRLSLLRHLFGNGLITEPREPLLGALWTSVYYKMRGTPPPERYINAKLEDWSLDITGKWEIPKSILESLEKVVDELVKFQEELMMQNHDTQENFKDIASEIEKQERYWTRRFVPAGELLKPAKSDHLAFAIWLVATEGSPKALRDAINNYLRYTSPYYIPDWYDVRRSIFYPTLIRIAAAVNKKLRHIQKPKPEEEPDMPEKPKDVMIPGNGDIGFEGTPSDDDIWEPPSDESMDTEDES